MAIAIFSTWTTYGTWLPGDHRGWYERKRGPQTPDKHRELDVLLRMSEDALILDTNQRRVVEKTIADHCAIRKWILHAAACRTNHVHVVITAPNVDIHVPREQFKAWCTRRLMDRERSIRHSTDHDLRRNWWTERGWDEYIDDEESLAEVVAYVVERQDHGGADGR